VSWRTLLLLQPWPAQRRAARIFSADVFGDRCGQGLHQPRQTRVVDFLEDTRKEQIRLRPAAWDKLFPRTKLTRVRVAVRAQTTCVVQIFNLKWSKGRHGCRPIWRRGKMIDDPYRGLAAEQRAARVAYRMAVDAVQHTEWMGSVVAQVTDWIRDDYEKVLDDNTVLGLAVFVIDCKCITAMLRRIQAGNMGKWAATLENARLWWTKGPEMFGINATEREGLSLLISSVPDDPDDDIDVAKVEASMFWYKDKVCIKSTDLAGAAGIPHNQLLLDIRRHFGRRPLRFGQVGRQPHPIILTRYEALAVLPSCQVPMVDRLRYAMLRCRPMCEERYQNPASTPARRPRRSTP
jgi:hypothetical protein